MMANSVKNCDQHLAIQVEKNLDINNTGWTKKMPHFMEKSSCICRLIPLLSDKVEHF